MIKKILALILAAALALSLVACGDVEEPAVEGGDGADNAAVTDSGDASVPDDAAAPDAAASPDETVPEETPVENAEDVPAADGEVPEVNLYDVRNMNCLGTALYESQTVRTTWQWLESDRTVDSVDVFEFYYQDNGYPAMQAAYHNDESGDSETMLLAGDNYAASYDEYIGFNKTLTVIPTPYYEGQLDAFWDQICPNPDYEVLTNTSVQDGATVFETFSYDEEYGENYTRGLYYLDGKGRIIYKELTTYLVEENAEIDAYLPYGIDEAPIMYIDTYTVEYGVDRQLDLSTDKRLTEGDTCEVTVHIVEGDYTETQTVNVVKDALLMVMNSYSVYETFTDEAMTDIFDIAEDMTGDTLEIWARNPDPGVG